MFRFVKIIIAAMAVIGLLTLAACSRSSGRVRQEALGAGEPFIITITLEGSADSRTSMIEDAFQELVSQKMGRPVEIRYTLIPGGDYGERAALLLAADDIDDFFQLPFLFDASRFARAGMFVNLLDYEDQLPRYFNYLDQTPAGRAGVTTVDGQIHDIIGVGLPRFEPDRGILPSNVSSYRYDIFEQHGIPIPQTLEDVYTAALRLKELYPNVYPINSRWRDLRSLFAANHVVADIFWNGEEYVFGPLLPGYRTAVEFARRLTADNLLDPEWILDSDDSLRSKLLTDRTFIVLCDWFTTPGELTRLSDSGQIFAATWFPNNPAAGPYAWQTVENVNQIARNPFFNGVISSRASNMDLIMEFIDLQFDPEIVQLLTWGIEGVTFYFNPDGSKSFVDEIMSASDPWIAADAYGMRASRNMRPGLGVIADATAFVALAPNDWLFYNGALHVEPIELSQMTLSLPFPNHPFVPPTFHEPVLMFSTEESDEIARNMQAIYTFIDENVLRYINGSSGFDTWDSTFIAGIHRMGNIERVLELYNAAADRFFAR
ncbi:MAG: hypothetical protein FWG89_02820 [Treponema sp.]|nr:hypothetical protein [Treponema sp.]